ncbi:MAG: LysM peptidoglycan-binding domain-containing protein [Lentisphaeria bacterium]|nr:LysM peptidoglycan-binding domain-containing protein [Lentisphaeria bacterium]
MKNFGESIGKNRALGLFFVVLCAPFVLCAQHVQHAQQDRSRYYEQLAGNLLQQLKVMQDENAKLAESVRELSRRTNLLEGEYRRLSGESHSLRQNSGAEKEASKNQYKHLEMRIDGMEKKLQRLEKLIRDVGSAAAQTPPPPPPRPERPAKKARPAEENAGASVEYREHTVERGHVLFNIAKAYHVSVQDIRSVNKLKSDKLFVGQKLLIPVKAEKKEK